VEKARRNIVDVKFAFVLENAEILRHEWSSVLIAKQQNLWFLSPKKEIKVLEKRKYRQKLKPTLRLEWALALKISITGSVGPESSSPTKAKLNANQT